MHTSLQLDTVSLFRGINMRFTIFTLQNSYNKLIQIFILTYTGRDRRDVTAVLYAACVLELATRFK